MDHSFLGYVIAAGLASVWAFIAFASLRAGSIKVQVALAKSQGRHRVITVDGVYYHAIRKTETILQATEGKSRSVLVSAGWERDPYMKDGKVSLRTRWIKIRSITKNGLSNHERWVRADKWRVECKREIEYHLPYRSANA